MLVEPNHARTEQLRSALNPLLSLLHETATKVQKVDGLGAHNWARGHDYAVIPETFDRQITSENAVGSIDRMKLMRDMLTEIPKFGVDPLPIIETFTGSLLMPQPLPRSEDRLLGKACDRKSKSWR